jgi:hypothetical protein
VTVATILPAALAIGLAIALGLSAAVGLLRPERLASDRGENPGVAAALR